ncbi:MAG: DUF3127 domain-containing protein [Cytophagales bacterium]|nr:DUF3127 domain-containing protein [Bernardetiaceae bacterium]MDW8203546.1 DUF3127 domain-containing protein [Cytophagales bacterium]
MSYEAKGKLVVIYNTQQVTEKFRKREFVVELLSGAYSEFVKFQLTQEKCNLLDGLSVGDEVKVSFTLRGRPYTKDGTTTYFTNLEAWRIEAITPANAGNTALPPEQASGFQLTEGDNDELPF